MMIYRIILLKAPASTSGFKYDAKWTGLHPYKSKISPSTVFPHSLTGGNVPIICICVFICFTWRKKMFNNIIMYQIMYTGNNMYNHAVSLNNKVFNS